jgi:hypothetical protein
MCCKLDTPLLSGKAKHPAGFFFGANDNVQLDPFPNEILPWDLS